MSSKSDIVSGPLEQLTGESSDSSSEEQLSAETKDLYRSVILSPLNIDDVQIPRSIQISYDTSYYQINEQLNAQLGGADRKLTVLKENYGSLPFWVFPGKYEIVPLFVKILYLVDRSKPLLIALLRTETGDQPLLIEPPISSLLNRPTILETLKSSAEAKGIMLKSGKLLQDFKDLTNETFEEIKKITFGVYYTFPTVFYALPDHTTSTFNFKVRPTTNRPIAAPFQATICDCEGLIDAATKAPCMLLECIHVSRALLHLAIGLVDSDEGGLEELWMNQEIRGMAKIFETVLHTLSKQSSLSLHSFQQSRLHMRSMEDLKDIFYSCCGSFPGAVAIRHSYAAYNKMALIDVQDLRDLCNRNGSKIGATMTSRSTSDHVSPSERSRVSNIRKGVLIDHLRQGTTSNKDNQETHKSRFALLPNSHDKTEIDSCLDFSYYDYYRRYIESARE